MDNGLLFPYHSCGDDGGTRKGRPGIPTGHGVFFIRGDVGVGKSAPNAIARDEGELRGNSRRSGRAQTVEKSLVIGETGVPVPQTDSGR